MDAPFAWLQYEHRTCRFSMVVAPPVATGMMWSCWMLKVPPHETLTTIGQG